MKQSNPKLLHIFYALTLSLALSIEYSPTLSVFIPIVFMNFIFILVIVKFNWKAIYNNFDRIYKSSDLYTKETGNHKFAGLKLTPKGGGETRASYIEEVKNGRNKLLSLLRKFIIYGVYITLHYKIIPIEALNLFSMGFSSMLILLLFTSNFWGSSLLTVFLSLIFVTIKIQFQLINEYVVFFIFMFSFFLTLKLFITWFWSNIGGIKKSLSLKIQMKQILPVITLFFTLFLLMDSYINKKNSFYDFVVSKIISSSVELIKHSPKTDRKKLLSDILLSTKSIPLSRVEKNTKDRIEQIDLNISAIGKDGHIPIKGLESYAELLSEQAQLINSLSTSRVEKHRASQLKKLVKNNHDTNKRMESLKKSKLNINVKGANELRVDEFKKLSQEFDRIASNKNLTQAQIQQLSSIGQNKSQLTRNMNFQIKHSSQKNSNNAAELKSINENIKKRLNSYQNNEIREGETSTPTNKVDLLKARDEIINEEIEKLDPIKEPYAINSLKIDKNNNVLKILEKKKEEINKLNVERTKNLEENNIAEKKKLKDRKRLKFILYIFAFLVLFAYIKRFLSRGKIKNEREKLTNEQTREIKGLLGKEPSSFSSLEEEIDYKYKKFYNFLEILYYEPDFPPPVSLIQFDIERISSTKVRGISVTLGGLFNAIHFQEKSSFNNKEIAKFRKSYNTYKIYANNFIKSQ